MNIVIIEDEKLTAQRLEKLIHTYDPTILVLARIPSVAGAVEWFKSNPLPAPDLVFMDIHLEDDLGFRIIEQVNLTIPIIFTTAYDEYTLQAFKANSIDYLLKLIDYDELVTAIEKFKTLGRVFSGPCPARPDCHTEPAGSVAANSFQRAVYDNSRHQNQEHRNDPNSLFFRGRESDVSHYTGGPKPAPRLQSRQVGGHARPPPVFPRKPFGVGIFVGYSAHSYVFGRQIEAGTYAKSPAGGVCNGRPDHRF